MAPLRGWAPRGHRLTAKVPHGRWKTMTFLAALRHDRIDAPWFHRGADRRRELSAYVEKVLLPTLRPGDIVVMDNLGSHRGKAVRQLIRSAGAKLFFLPKYSPDLNPIEQVFAKLKHLPPKGCRPNRLPQVALAQPAAGGGGQQRTGQLPPLSRPGPLRPVGQVGLQGRDGGRGERDPRLPGALADHAHHPVAGVLAQVGDVGSASLVHAQGTARSAWGLVSASAAATRARTWPRSTPTVAV